MRKYCSPVSNRWYYHMKIGIIAQCLNYWLNKPTVWIRLRCPPTCITYLLDTVLTDIGDFINVSFYLERDFSYLCLTIALWLIN